MSDSRDRRNPRRSGSHNKNAWIRATNYLLYTPGTLLCRGSARLSNCPAKETRSTGLTLRLLRPWILTKPINALTLDGHMGNACAVRTTAIALGSTAVTSNLQLCSSGSNSSRRHSVARQTAAGSETRRKHSQSRNMH